jgi:hypothetical protein
MADTAIYRVPLEATQERAEVHGGWRERRAQLLHAVLGLVAVQEQPTALSLVLQLEALHTTTTDTLVASWLGTVQRAYTDGCAESAKDAALLERVSTESEEADLPSDAVH